MKVIPAVHSDLSPPLRDQPVVWPQAGEKREKPPKEVLEGSFHTDDSLFGS